jgi:hypothetical protein
MNKRILLGPALVLLFLTGCTENMDSISRQLRNCNNEAIDAMMMVTSEKQAERMLTRVLKPLNERYKDIERKLESWEANRTGKEMVEDTFKSNGFYLYIAELEVNRQRFGLEKARLRKLYQQYLESADNDPAVSPRDRYPNLYELVMTDRILKTIETQLRDPKLKLVVNRFPEFKNVENYRELYEKEFLKRKETIKADRIELVR